MLETIRVRLERLADSGEEVAVRAAHAAFYLALGERTAPLLRGSESRAQLASLEREHSNLRAALAWFEARGEAEDFLRLAAALGYFWSMWPLERGQWLAGARPGRRSSAPPARLEALENLGENAGYQGDVARAEVVLRRGSPWPAAWAPGRRSAACCMPFGAQLVDQGRYGEGEILRRVRGRGTPGGRPLRRGVVRGAPRGRGVGAGRPCHSGRTAGSGADAGARSQAPNASGERQPLPRFDRHRGRRLRPGGRVAPRVARLRPGGHAPLARSALDVASLAAAREEAEQAARLFGRPRRWSKRSACSGLAGAGSP